MKQKFFWLPFAIFASVSPLSAENGLLCLDETIEAAIVASPLLVEADARIQIKLAECWQAGLIPNPVLSVEIDGLSKRTSRDLDLSLGVTQLLELGCKRSARQNIVAAETEALLSERQLIESKLVQTAYVSFINYVAAKEKAKQLLLSEEVSMAKSLCLEQLVKTGKVKVTDQRRSSIAYRNKQMERSRIQVDATTARRKLLQLTGNVNANHEFEEEDLFDVSPPEPLSFYLERFPSSPEFEQLRSKQLAAYYRYSLERANAIPDLAVTAGVERENWAKRYSLFFQVDVEIPIFNRNQGNIAAACWNSAASELEIEILHNKLTLSCQELHESMSRSFETIMMIRNEQLPIAEELLHLHADLEQQQKQICLERLEAAEQLHQLYLQYIDALREYHEIKAELLTICGLSISQPKTQVINEQSL
jgi:cobalt-zinc-cadmium efflux system outer membrane protein